MQPCLSLLVNLLSGAQQIPLESNWKSQKKKKKNLEISLSFILVLQLLVMPSSLIRKSQTKAFHESFTRYNPTFLTINMFHLVKEVSY